MNAPLFLAAALLATAFVAPCGAQSPPALTPRLVASGLAQPMDIANARDVSDRLFVVERAGRVRIVKDRALYPAPFLDLTAEVSTAGDGGMKAIAFDPQFRSNRRFFVSFTRISDGALQVASFLASAVTPDLADPASRVDVITIPTGTQNVGGDLAFDYDGMLWISVGDGGPDGDPGNHAQDPASLRGKLLRIDVSVAPYQVPPTNPSWGAGARPEIARMGVRDPRKIAFDRAFRALFVADAGQRYQEVNADPLDPYDDPAFQLRERNYGWRPIDGLSCYDPPSGCYPFLYKTPITFFDNADPATGGPITGGEVYRGQLSARLRGYYVFADFQSSRIWAGRQVAASWQGSVVLDAPNALQGISSFGVDEAGELYVTSYADGKLYALDPADGEWVPPRHLQLPQSERPDFDNDGRTDAAWTKDSFMHELWLMNGTAYTAATPVLPVPSVLWQIADYDGDGRSDVLWRERDGGYRVDLMNGLAATTSVRLLPGGYRWEVIGGGDFNADGRRDLLWQNERLLGVWLMNGISFTSAFVTLPVAWDSVVATGDFNGDGRTDLLTRTSSGAVSVSLLDGATVLSAVEIYPAGRYWAPVAVADFDGDGKSDILWRSEGLTYGIWLMDGAVRTASRVIRSGVPGWTPSYECCWQPPRALIRDYDGDGRADIVWMNGEVRHEMWLMDANMQVKAVLPLSGAGTQWLAVAAGDYDGDGRNDLLWREGLDGAQTRVMTGFAPPVFGTIAAPGAGWRAALGYW